MQIVELGSLAGLIEACNRRIEVLWRNSLFLTPQERDEYRQLTAERRELLAEAKELIQSGRPDLIRQNLLAMA